MTEPLAKAAQDFVWTLFVRCRHDNEGHNLPAIERYLVRRWSRTAIPAIADEGLDVARLRAEAEMMSDPIGGLDLLARLVADYSSNPNNPNVSALLRHYAQDLRSALAPETSDD